MLPSIDIAERRIIARRPNMEYAPIAGIPEFNDLTLKVVYGWESAAIEEERIAVVSTLSGTGSLRVCGEFVDKFLPRLAPEATVYLPDVTWGNHKGIFAAAGLGVKSYTYYDPKTCGFDFTGMCADLTAMPDGSAVLLHSVGHNPTGVDPTKEQWRALSDICLAKRHFPIFDTAYQGFATGDAEADAFSVRLFVEEGHSLACCQSYAKNMGMYGQRCGALSVVCPDADEAKRVKSHLSKIVRTMWSSPPLHGSRIAAEVLKDTELRAMWYGEMKMMSSRISDMRTALRNRLLELGSKEPNAWRHLVDQVGMFCFTGLTAEQVGGMRSKHHIYMLSNGRISVAGVNTKNVDYIANAMHDVTKDVAEDEVAEDSGVLQMAAKDTTATATAAATAAAAATTKAAAASSPSPSSPSPWAQPKHRCTLGFVQVPTDLVLEMEAPALLRNLPGVDWRFQKLAFDGDDELINADTYGRAAPNITAAARTFIPRFGAGGGHTKTAANLDVLAMACTSISFVLGRERVWSSLREGQGSEAATSELTITDMATSQLRAIAAVGGRRIALLTPYIRDVHDRNVAFLEESGVEVVRSHHMCLTLDEETSAVPLEVLAEEVRRLAEGPQGDETKTMENRAGHVDAIVVGCSAFRVCVPGFIDHLEELAGGIPVVTSTQAILWDAVRLAGVDDVVEGYGTLFRLGQDGEGSRHDVDKMAPQ